MTTDLRASLRDWRVWALAAIVLVGGLIGLVRPDLAFLPLLAAPVVVSAVLGRPVVTGVIGLLAIALGALAAAVSGHGLAFPAEVVVATLVATLLAGIVAQWKQRVQAEERRYRLLAENASDVVLQLDEANVVRWASPSVAAVLGWPPEGVLGRRLSDLLDPQGPELDVSDGLAGPTAPFKALVRTTGGSSRWMRCVCHRATDEWTGAVACVLSMSDVHEQQAADDRRRQAEDRFRNLVREAPIPMCFGPASGVFAEFNEALCDFFEVPGGSLRGRRWQEFTHPDDLESDQTLAARLARGEIDRYRILKRYVTSTGDQRYGDLTVSRLSGTESDEVWAVAQIVDVTAEIEARRRLEALADFDGVTGLHSRSWILRDLDRRFAHAEPVTVLFIDVSEYLAVSRTMGYESADSLVAELADSLRVAVPTAFPLGRFEGYRFVALLPSMSEGELTDIAERILAEIAQETLVNGLRLSRTGSVGIARSAGHATPQSLLRDADRALAKAKESGRSRLAIMDPDDWTGEAHTLQLESELRQALDQGQFAVHYQPQVRLSDGAVVGHEALVRWQHPTRGLIGPVEFIGVMEHAGLIESLDRQVLEQVCADLAARASTLKQVSVNVSSLELTEAGWWTRASRIIGSSGVDPRRLVVELTEGQILNLTPDARASLAALGQEGISMHVDDFGTGFASVGLLTSVAIDGVKLDRSFVSALSRDDRPGDGRGEDSRPEDIARGICQLADALHLVTIAEGIETPEQARAIAALGWQIGQGYYFGRPAPLATVASGPGK